MQAANRVRPLICDLSQECCLHAPHSALTARADKWDMPRSAVPLLLLWRALRRRYGIWAGVAARCGATDLTFTLQVRRNVPHRARTPERRAPEQAGFTFPHGAGWKSASDVGTPVPPADLTCKHRRTAATESSGEASDD